MKLQFGWFPGNNLFDAAWRMRRPARLALMVALGLIVAAGAPPAVAQKVASNNRGINIPHKQHVDADIACTDCHALAEGKPGYPNHETCQNCHEIDMDNPEPKKCGMCHTDPDFNIKPRTKKMLGAGVVFNHQPHADKEVACKTCHLDADKQILPNENRMAFCTDCHAKQGNAKLNDCQTCHQTPGKVKKVLRPDVAFNHAPHVDKKVACTSCHTLDASKQYLPGGNRMGMCVDCHTKQGGGKLNDCQTCHQTPGKVKNVLRADITFSHQPHTAKELACNACHNLDASKHYLPDGNRMGMCVDCHTKQGGGKLNDCQTCHQAPGEVKKVLRADITFNHQPHVAKEVACNACHNLDASKHYLPDGKRMDFCVDCHTKKGGGKLNDCQTCHQAPGEVKKVLRADITFKHQPHVAKQVACNSCHNLDASKHYVMDGNRMAVCVDCHTKQGGGKLNECQTCHRAPGEEKRVLSPELKFSHAPHVAKQVACNSCHTLDAAKHYLPGGKLMPVCMDCHTKQDQKMAECQVCHKEIDKDVRPVTRHVERMARVTPDKSAEKEGKRAGKKVRKQLVEVEQAIPHDKTEIWEKIHGQEWLKDQQDAVKGDSYCGRCHESEEFCNDCHRKNPPKSHTAAWRDSTHGLRAEWDRRTCSVCHEEDMCVRCHQKTEPRSHTGGWGGTAARHCQSCHMPAQRTDNCTVCHEEIDHERAPQSPHNAGQYPAPCSMCHPLVPGRAPHPVNATARCKVCHE